MRLSCKFVFTPDLQIIRSHTGQEFYHAQSVFGTVNIAPIHTVEIGIIETAHRLSVIRYVQHQHAIDTIFGRRLFRDFYQRKYLTYLLGNPGYQQTRFPVIIISYLMGRRKAL